MSDVERPAWIARTRELLDESASSLDAATLSRLNRARQAALQQRRRRALALRWLPAGLAIAAVLVLALALWPAPPRVPPAAVTGAAAPAAAADSDAADDLDFYQDLEFYAWLDAEEQDGDG